MATKDFFQKNKSYFLRTVTYHLVGKCVSANAREIVLTAASWVADSGRYHQAMTTGVLSEVEPYPPKSRILVNRSALIDAVEWSHPLPTVQK